MRAEERRLGEATEKSSIGQGLLVRMLGPGPAVDDMEVNDMLLGLDLPELDELLAAEGAISCADVGSTTIKLF